MQLWDLVTYEGCTDGGDGSRFTFRQVDDSPLITLISPTLLPAETTAGTRMIIRYIPESGEAYTSSNITLLSAARINQSPVATEWKERSLTIGTATKCISTAYGAPATILISTCGSPMILNRDYFSSRLIPPPSAPNIQTSIWST